MRSQIIFISNSVIPDANSGGGGIVLYRHLKRLQDEGHQILIIHCIPGNFKASEFEEIYLPRQFWHPPLRKSSPFLTTLRAILYRFQLRKIPNISDSVILSLFGDYTNLLAVMLSKKHGIPLYMIYHDDGLFNAYGNQNILSRAHIKEIISSTRHFFAVSKPMKKLLDENNAGSSSVLYPIPEGYYGVRPETSSSVTKFYNTGLLFEDLHLELLQKLAFCAESANSYLVNVGRLTPSFEKKLNGCSRLSIINRFETTKQLIDHLLANADVLLVFYSFKIDLEHRMYTSFPSKLAEYSHLGKPIFIIAPAISSLGKWAIENNWMSYLDSDNSEQIIDMMKRFEDPDFRNNCIEQSIKVSKTLFDPNIIHRHLTNTMFNHA